MEDEWSIYDSEVMASGYDCTKFEEVLEHSKRYLLKLDAEKRLEIIREVLKNPNFDDTDVYYLVEIEIQDPSYKPPPVVPKPPPVVPKKPPLKIRFVMSGRPLAKPVWEEEKAAKKSETTGRKRPRASSDCEFDDEEESGKANMKKANNSVQKKKVNEKREFDSEEIIPELPAEFKKRIIQNLGGTEPTLVIQKELTYTDVSTMHTRLSLPRGKLKDQQFLSKEKAFKQNSNGVAEMAARLVAEDGKVHEIDVRRWSMSKGIYVLAKGWNDVVLAHGLRAERIVQLWSFRVEGNLWFALVKL